ncbi:hypothetical protein HPB49_007265 [Dermacentor silvarum]|uniref:Uncharacterized protein n=1 Tax=Dermacentor silvarum TaxID=543639 RepID=A0ACB8CJN0_DERSI|nr:hypothetical protein HPB49_007265 [Dermacentor silvarum]
MILGHLRRADELCDQLERTRATGAGVSPGVAPTTSPPASYAAVVRGGVPVRGAPGAAGPSPGTVVPPGGATDSAIRRDHAHIMFLTPLVPTSTAADDLSAAMKNNVDLVKERIGDIRVRKTPRGLTILSDDKESMDRLRAALESNVVTNTTMSIRFAQKRKPHVKLTGVDPDVPAVNLIAQLNARNPTLTVDPSTCSVRTSFKERSGNFTHVLEVDPPTFRSLMARGRVAVGWTSAAVVEDVHVPTCTFCATYGHPRSACPVRQQADRAVCTRCAGDHLATLYGNFLQSSILAKQAFFKPSDAYGQEGGQGAPSPVHHGRGGITMTMEITVEGTDIEPNEMEEKGWVVKLKKCVEKRRGLKVPEGVGNAKTASHSGGGEEAGCKVAGAENSGGVRSYKAVGRKIAERSVASRPPKLPDDGWKVIIRPKGGLAVIKNTSQPILGEAVHRAASLEWKKTKSDLLFVNDKQGTILFHTLNFECAEKVMSIKTIKIEDKDHEVTAYTWWHLKTVEKGSCMEWTYA